MVQEVPWILINDMQDQILYLLLCSFIRSSTGAGTPEGAHEARHLFGNTGAGKDTGVRSEFSVASRCNFCGMRENVHGKTCNETELCDSAGNARKCGRFLLTPHPPPRGIRRMETNARLTSRIFEPRCFLPLESCVERFSINVVPSVQPKNSLQLGDS